jgi:hypothetical protein
MEAPGFKSFTKVHGKSYYSKNIGYGWLDEKGTFETGKWHGDKFKTWESYENLNIICRKGPDDLARSYATGLATFALDLSPGKYEVWILSGDSGFLEYIPHEPYRIIVEDATAHDFKITSDEFYRQFETPIFEDDLTYQGVWNRYIEQRFKWVKTIVEVKDGQLNVVIDCDRRDRSILNFVGDYAITEIRRGPKDQFTGAINAMIVIPAEIDDSVKSKEIKRTEYLRLQNFIRNWPLEDVRPKENVKFAPIDQKRGYTIFFPNILKPVNPTDRKPHEKRTIKLRATPGEYVPITFAVCPLKMLGITEVESKGLHLTTLDTNPNMSFYPTIGVVRYTARPIKRRSKSWRPLPVMIVPTNSWKILKGITKQFWLTYHIPDKMKPGYYKDVINIKPDKANETNLTIELEVLPFKLKRPTNLAIGMTYFSPAQYSYFDEELFWTRMEAEFTDMRKHNMTCIQYTGIQMDDYDRIEKAFMLYRKAGFEHPVNLLESYGAMHRLQRKGIQWETDIFQTEYVNFIRDFLEVAKRRNWPPIIINFGDEFTNEALEEFGAKLARNLKKIPGIVTGADTNGYKEVKLMAPEVDIIAFNNGWDGPTGVNRGKRLLKKETVELIKRSGAIPWLVNVGTDRFSNGYWFWKMIRLGIRGKMEWIYRGYNGMPFNSFDARPLRRHVAYPGPNGTIVPSLNYEWMRMGLDDLAYLYTLEFSFEMARKDPAMKVAASKADAFLKKLDHLIEDDMSKYRDFSRNGKLTWPLERFDEIRDEVIDLILELNKK